MSTQTLIEIYDGVTKLLVTVFKDEFNSRTSLIDQFLFRTVFIYTGVRLDVEHSRTLTLSPSDSKFLIIVFTNISKDSVDYFPENSDNNLEEFLKFLDEFMKNASKLEKDKVKEVKFINPEVLGLKVFVDEVGEKSKYLGNIPVQKISIKELILDHFSLAHTLNGDFIIETLGKISELDNPFTKKGPSKIIIWNLLTKDSKDCYENINKNLISLAKTFWPGLEMKFN